MTLTASEIKVESQIKTQKIGPSKSSIFPLQFFWQIESSNRWMDKRVSVSIRPSFHVLGFSFSLILCSLGILQTINQLK